MIMAAISQLCNQLADRTDAIYYEN